MAYLADKKPGELTALTSLATDDVVVVGDTSDASEVAKGITKANFISDLSTSFASQGITTQESTPLFLVQMITTSLMRRRQHSTQQSP